MTSVFDGMLAFRALVSTQGGADPDEKAMPALKHGANEKRACDEIPILFAPSFHELKNKC